MRPPQPVRLRPRRVEQYGGRAPPPPFLPLAGAVSTTVASRVRRPFPVPLPPARRPLRPGWVASEFLPSRPCPVPPPLTPAPSLLAIRCPQPAAPLDAPTSSATADLAEKIVRRLEEDLTFSRHDPGALDRLIQGAQQQQEKQERRRKDGEIEDLRRLLNRQWEEVKTPQPSPTPTVESAPVTQPGSEEESGLSPEPLPLGKQWALPKVVRTPFMQPPVDPRKARGSRKRTRRSEPHSHGARSASSRGLSPPRRQERIDRPTQSAPASRASPVLAVRSVVRVVPPPTGVEEEKKKPGKEGSMTPPVPPLSAEIGKWRDGWLPSFLLGIHPLLPFPNYLPIGPRPRNGGKCPPPLRPSMPPPSGPRKTWRHDHPRHPVLSTDPTPGPPLRTTWGAWSSWTRWMMK